MSYEQYASNTTYHQVYFENNGYFIKQNQDGSVVMVRSRQNATLFTLSDYCNSDAQRIHYDLVIKNDEDDKYRVLDFVNTFEIKEQIVLKESDNSIGNFHIDWGSFIKENFNKENDYKVNFVAFVCEKKAKNKEKSSFYAFDNYGDGRLVWYHCDMKNSEYNIKSNQKFKVIYV